MNAIDIIEKYRRADPDYAQTLMTLMYNANFEAGPVIERAEKEGKRISFKDGSDASDEYTEDDIVIS